MQLQVKFNKVNCKSQKIELLGTTFSLSLSFVLRQASSTAFRISLKALTSFSRQSSGKYFKHIRMMASSLVVFNACFPHTPRQLLTILSSGVKVRTALLAAKFLHERHPCSAVRTILVSITKSACMLTDILQGVVEIDTGGAATVDASGVSIAVTNGIITDDGTEELVSDTMIWLIFSSKSLSMSSILLRSLADYCDTKSWSSSIFCKIFCVSNDSCCINSGVDNSGPGASGVGLPTSIKSSSERCCLLCL